MTSTLIVITGPTGVGKSEVSMRIARYFNTEIISADSRQMFREMKTGTAAPGVTDMNQINHHFVGSLTIRDPYNAGKFEMEVVLLLENLFRTYPLVLMTGGSMLYIDAVCKGIDDLPAVDPEIRKNLTEKFETEGIESLRFDLKKLDPVYYRQVDLHNPKRLLHALEMCIMSGKPYSELRTRTHKKRPFHIVKIGLTADRQVLYERINRRVDQMIASGLEDEVRNLLHFRLENALNTVGYREWFDYFDGKISKEAVVEKIKSNSRRYARKQMTWFRKDPDISWFDISETEKIIPFIEETLSKNNSNNKQQTTNKEQGT
jgi:tRNA dimethylallyltransferase